MLSKVSLIAGSSSDPASEAESAIDSLNEDSLLVLEGSMVSVKEGGM